MQLGKNETINLNDRIVLSSHESTFVFCDFISSEVVVIGWIIPHPEYLFFLILY